MRFPGVQSRPVYERPGYRTLRGRIRGNIRPSIGKQLELPRQEIAELLAANMRAAIWLGIAAGLAFTTLITLVVLIIALVALVPRDWLGILVLGLSIGAAVALLVLATRARKILAGLFGAIVIIAVGVLAFLFLPELALAALLLTIALSIGAAATGYGGYSRLELHGPTRTINSVKETIRGAKTRLLGPRAS